MAFYLYGTISADTIINASLKHPGHTNSQAQGVLSGSTASRSLRSFRIHLQGGFRFIISFELSVLVPYSNCIVIRQDFSSSIGKSKENATDHPDEFSRW